jgi:hypothetical protein
VGYLPAPGALRLFLLARSALDMMQVRRQTDGMQAVEGAVPAIDVQPLGRWRLAGEICDGRCFAGALRPGRGLAHKACANPWLLRMIPAAFVSSQHAEGAEFLVIVGRGGAHLPENANYCAGPYILISGRFRRSATARRNGFGAWMRRPSSF